MVHVLERLSFAELAACAPVCRAWRRLCRCDQVWSRRCARRWCLGAMAHFAQDSPIRRGWESGKEGAALLEQLTALGLKGEPELSRAADAIAQLRQLSCALHRAADGSEAAAAAAAGSGEEDSVVWWRLFREVETKPLSTSWLQVGDHVDCRCGGEDPPPPPSPLSLSLALSLSLSLSVRVCAGGATKTTACIRSRG